MKVAIVHDFLNQYGGAERVVEVFHEMFPEAPVFTSIYLSEKMPSAFRAMDIRTSFMQKFPFLHKHAKKYFLFYPLAFRSFNLQDYDLILSSSSSYAKGIRTTQRSVHICYCHTPARFIWRYENYIEQENFPSIIKGLIKFFVKIFLKGWDLRANKGVDYFIANSHYIKGRIASAYARSSDVIYPPVTVDQFSVSQEVGDYFLVVSRLNTYKKIDIAIEAFNALGKPLYIVGDGPYRRYLQEIAKDNIHFMGKVSEQALLNYFSRCRAYILPGEEDFGITPVEAQACGRPVIAYGRGGVLETVIDGVSGVFFQDQTKESLIDGIHRFEFLIGSLDPSKIRQHAEQFSVERFKHELMTFIEDKLKVQGIA